MNLTRCGNGHFYDQDKFGGNCPHCASGGPVGNSQVTMALTQSDISSDVTMALEQNEGSGTLQEAVASAMAASPTQLQTGGDGKTISFFDKSFGKEPVVGWLVCIEGSHFGEDFRLKSGRNFIGRSPSMDVIISNDNTVSREKHAAIVYEPKQHIFLVQSGESKELCYLNDAVVLASQEIKELDEITVGETKLKFFPCCSQKFNWDLAKKESEDDKK